MASRGLLRFHHSRFPTLLVRNTLIRTQGYATCTVATSTCESFSSRRLFPRAVHNGNFRSQRLVLSFPYGVRPRSSFPSEELMSDVAIGTADVATSATDVVAGTANIASELVSFSDLGLCHYTPIGMVEFLFEQAHLTLGMPWVPAIISVTMLYRAVAFPLYLVCLKNSIQLRPIVAQLSYLRKERKTVRETLGKEAAGEVIRRAQRLRAKHNYTKRSYMFVLLPTAIHQLAFASLMLALHKTASVPIASMKTGGLWFFSDLTVPDPLFVLPVVAVALSLLNTTKLIPGTDAHNPSFAKKYALVFRAVPVLGLPVIALFPAAMQLLFVTVSGSFTLCQLTFRIPAMRRFIGIPTEKLRPEAEDIRPLTFWEIIEKIKQKFRKSEKYTIKTFDHNPLAGEKRDLSENEKSKNPGKEKVRKSGKIAVQAKRQKAKRRKI